MLRRSESNGYRNYPYIPPSDPITSLNPMTSLNSSGSVRRTTSFNNNYQRYNPPKSTEETYYTNTTLIPTYTSECFQRFYQAPTIRSDLTDSSWFFDDLGPPVNYRFGANATSSEYVPPNPIKRSTVSDTRLETASTMREQLLSDILRDMSDINDEISSLEGALSRSRQFPNEFSPVMKKNTQFRHSDLDQPKYLPAAVKEQKDENITSNWN